MCVNCQPIKTCTLFTWFICVTLQKMADTIQDEHEATFKFINEVHNSLAVWDISSVVYKDTKNKQKKMKELADKLGFVQAFLFLHRFLFLLLSSSVSLFYVSATALSQPALLQITVCCDLTRVWRVKVGVCQLFEVCRHQFANLSLPCGGCFSQWNIGYVW